MDFNKLSISPLAWRILSILSKVLHAVPLEETMGGIDTTRFAVVTENIDEHFAHFEKDIQVSFTSAFDEQNLGMPLSFLEALTKSANIVDSNHGNNIRGAFLPAASIPGARLAHLVWPELFEQQRIAEQKAKANPDPLIVETFNSEDPEDRMKETLKGMAKDKADNAKATDSSSKNGG
jgi:hypothetical protein